MELMRAGVEYSFEISIRQFKVFVRPLTNLEIIQATASAAESYERLPDSQRLSVTASLLNAMHQLEKAASVDVGEVSALPLAILQMMTPDEVNHLWKQYCRVMDKVNPDFQFMSIEELNVLVEDLKKSLDKLSQLTDLSISNLIAVCRHLLSESTD